MLQGSCLVPGLCVVLGLLRGVASGQGLAVILQDAVLVLVLVLVLGSCLKNYCFGTDCYVTDCSVTDCSVTNCSVTDCSVTGCSVHSCKKQTNIVSLY